MHSLMVLSLHKLIEAVLTHLPTTSGEHFRINLLPSLPQQIMDNWKHYKTKVASYWLIKLDSVKQRKVSDKNHFALCVFIKLKHLVKFVMILYVNIHLLLSSAKLCQTRTQIMKIKSDFRTKQFSRAEISESESQQRGEQKQRSQSGNQFDVHMDHRGNFLSH